MMSCMVSKGQRVSLSEEAKTQGIYVGMGWEAGRQTDMELDMSAFLLNKERKTNQDGDFVFYGNDRHGSGCIAYLDFPPSFLGGSEKAVFHVDLAKVPVPVERIAFSATIYEAEERSQNFGQVKDVFLNISGTDGKESATVSIKCPSCGAENEVGNKFCGQCGTKLV